MMMPTPRDLWSSNLDRLVEEIARLEAEVERLRFLLQNGQIAESSSTDVRIGPIVNTTLVGPTVWR